MEFVPSTRGNKELLVMDRYIYSQQKTLAGGVISWECVERRNAKSCIAKIKTLNGNEVGRLHEHTHPADVEKINVLKIKAEMKRRAQITAENIKRCTEWCRCWSRRGDISTLPEGRNNETIYTERKATGKLASTSPTGKRSTVYYSARVLCNL